MAITTVEEFGNAVETLILEAKAAGIPSAEIVAELEGILDGIPSDDDEPAEGMTTEPKGFGNIVVYWTCVFLAGCLVGIASCCNRLAGQINQLAKNVLKIADRCR